MELLRKFKADVVFALLLIVLNIIFSFDYLWHGTKPANFDAIAHITTIAQYHKSLSDGEFPVGWGDGFANYGLPLGTIAHQIPAYGGAFLTFLTHDVLLSFHIMYLIGAVVSAIFFYILLRKFFSSEAAFFATIIYSLAPYRIINFYMRGAMPEFFSAVWVPVIMLAIYELHQNHKRLWPYVLLLVGAVGLILTHPMMLVIYAPILFLWFLFFIKLDYKYFIGIGVAGLLAIGITAYYFLPLNLETKYLYHGITNSHYAPNQTTSIESFINPTWLYNCTFRNDIFGRCHLIKAGVTETFVLVVATIITILFLIFRNKPKLKSENKLIFKIWLFALIGGWIAIAFSSVLFEQIYMRVRILGNIQYPWRYLSSYLFMPPILLGVMYEWLKEKRWVVYVSLVLVAFIVFARFPQLYGKNYTYLPQSYYYFTPLNLHSFMMNTIWSGNTDEYPIKREKAEIVEGRGVIESKQIKNASRIYKINAETNLTVSDYTFYFPGWNVYIDGKLVSIEFQNPNYRGVITFQVPPGEHTVKVMFEDTKVRLLGKYITVGSVVATLLICATYLVIKKRRL
ncbi:MAG: hypothetical protein U0525_00385 [Patescibacteria group bacterium]